MYADLLSCNMDCGIKYVWTVAGSLHYSFILSAGLVVIFLDKNSESTACTNTIQTDIIIILFWTYEDLSKIPCCLSIHMQNHLVVNTRVNYPCSSNTFMDAAE